MKIVTQYKGREEENKKYAITHRLLLDLVAICLVFFFSSLFFLTPLLMSTISLLTELHKKGKKKVNY